MKISNQNKTRIYQVWECRGEQSDPHKRGCVAEKYGFCAFLRQSETTRVRIKHDLCATIYIYMIILPGAAWQLDTASVIPTVSNNTSPPFMFTVFVVIPDLESWINWTIFIIDVLAVKSTLPHEHTRHEQLWSWKKHHTHRHIHTHTHTHTQRERERERERLSDRQILDR